MCRARGMTLSILLHKVPITGDGTIILAIFLFFAFLCRVSVLTRPTILASEFACKDTKHDQPPSSTTVLALPLLKFPRDDDPVEPYGGEKYAIRDRPMESRLSSWDLSAWTDLSIDHDLLIIGCQG